MKHTSSTVYLTRHHSHSQATPPAPSSALAKQGSEKGSKKGDGEDKAKKQILYHINGKVLPGGEQCVCYFEHICVVCCVAVCKQKVSCIVCALLRSLLKTLN